MGRRRRRWWGERDGGEREMEGTGRWRDRERDMEG